MPVSPANASGIPTVDLASIAQQIMDFINQTEQKVQQATQIKQLQESLAKSQKND